MDSPFGVFRAQALSTPNAPLLIAPASLDLSYAPDGFRYTYSEVMAATLELAERFATAGYGAGQRVALLLQNRPEFFSHWLALNSLAVSIVPLNPDLRPEELQYQLNVADVDLIVAYSCEAATLDGFVDTKVRISEVGGPIPLSTRSAFGRGPRAEDECALLFTSGSTGKPKGCILSNNYFLILATWYVTQGGIAQVEPNREVALKSATRSAKRSSTA